MSDSLTDGSEFVENDDPIDLDESTAEASSPSEDQPDTGTDAKEPTIDQYQAAVESLEEKSSDSEEQNQDQEGDADPAVKEEEAGEDEDLPDEISDDELKAYKPKTRKRIEKLLGDVKERDERIAALETPAEEYGKITNYLRETGTTFEQAGDAVEVAALLNSNPEEAWKRLVPIVQELGQRLGHYLPQDLANQVKSGHLTREHAVQLARAQAGERLAKEQQQRHTQLVEEQQRQARNQVVAAMDKAAADRFGVLASSDPDFEMKRARVTEKLQVQLQHAQKNGTLPRNVDEAIHMVNTAYAAVNEELKPFMRKPAVTPVDGGTRSRAGAPPRDKYEAAAQALSAGS